MWPTEIKLDMLGPAKRRWKSLAWDDRVILAHAFRDATLNPTRVADYTLQFHHHESSGEVILIHKFRIGFATFILIDTSKTLFIFDLWLDDEIAIAAE